LCGGHARFALQSPEIGRHELVRRIGATAAVALGWPWPLPAVGVALPTDKLLVRLTARPQARPACRPSEVVHRGPPTTLHCSALHCSAHCTALQARPPYCDPSILPYPCHHRGDSIAALSLSWSRKYFFLILTSRILQPDEIMHRPCAVPPELPGKHDRINTSLPHAVGG
jgi:hypothetical protein